MKEKNIKSILKKIIIFILIIIVLLILTIIIIWKNEIRTILSIKEIMPSNIDNRQGHIYEMTVYGDYYLDDFLKQGGAKNDKELINFMTKKITKGLFDLSIEESDIGCSSFAASLENGDKVFGRNYDMSETNIAIVHTNPKGRYKSISSIDLNFIGIDPNSKIETIKDKFNTLAAAYTPLDGMNEKGVTVGIYMSDQGPKDKCYPTDQNTDKPDVPSTVLLRIILDKAATVDEAVEIAKKYDMHDSANSSFHYMVTDSTGKSAVLEYVAATDSTDIDGSKRELKVIYNDDPKSLSETDKFQVVTNFIVYPGYYKDGDQMAGLDRFSVLKDTLSKKNGILKDEEDAMNTLKLVGKRDWNVNDTDFRKKDKKEAEHLLKLLNKKDWNNNDSNSVTNHSIIFNTTKKTIYWVGNEHYGEEDYIRRYDLSK